MRFEVPQFIEIEDKIFGPLTWRQFVYVGGGAGMATVLFFVAPFWIFILFGLPIGGLTFMLGFFPINNRPFSIFLEALLHYFGSERLYLWHKKNAAVYKNNNSDMFSEKNALHTPPTSNQSLHSLSRKLELNAMQK